GLLPPQAKLLFKVTGLKLRAQQLGISKIDASAETGKISFAQHTRVDPGSVVQLVQQQSRVFKLAGPNHLQFRHGLNDADKRIAFINEVLDKLRVVNKSAA